MRAGNRSGRLSCLLLLLLAPPGAHAGDVAADEPAALTADRLVLSGLDGTPRAFDDLLGDGRAVCFAFLHPVCPLARDYAPVLDGLAREFAAAGIRFVGVVCEYDETAEVEAYAREYAIGFPVHLDADFALADALGATTTPQVVLVDRDRRIRYSGRVVDRSRVRGVMTPGDPEPELASAIRDLLAGRAVRVPVTQAVGCPLDRPERPGAAADRSTAHAVTFFRDVLPFLHRNCQKCHSPGQAGPFPLLSYDDAVD